MGLRAERSVAGEVPSLAERVGSLRWRIGGLGQLRQLLPLKPHIVLARQWDVIEQQADKTRKRLLDRVERVTRTLPGADVAVAQKAADALGSIEMELTYAYSFFDTFMDVLSQRLSPALGEVLAGCDRIAAEALKRDHVALRAVEPPIVYCDRGLGASVLREGIKFPDGTLNPLPLVQIPYARLQEKYNLTSAIHEVGHQALVLLKLSGPLSRALSETAKHVGAEPAVAELYGLWASELGPDFWAFCASGAAQTATIRDILSLAQAQVVTLSTHDPHPPPLIRVLISCAWCRELWGRGPWDAWERSWRDLYPLRDSPKAAMALLEQALRHVPQVAKAFLTTKFAALERRRIVDLFDMAAIEPTAQRMLAKRTTPLNDALPLAAQLGVFRWQREEGVSEDKIDAQMTDWLVRLSRRGVVTMTRS
jgi:hypothetical protein